MPVGRHFLGWDAPVLPRATRWLRDRFAASANDLLDLSNVTVVTPTKRSGRRLLELLTLEAGDRGLSPPTIVTPGGLPELLFRCEDTADALGCLLARVKVLRELPDFMLRKLTGDPPAHDDLRGWWSLATELSDLTDQLAAESLTPAMVAEASADPARWMLIADVEAQVEDCLADQGLVDCHRARRRALEEGPCEASGEIVLVAVADLNKLTRRFLEKVADRVHALVAAPPEEAAAFDEFGGLVTEAWIGDGRRIEISDTQLVMADRPRDQARAVVETIARATADRPIAPDAITVGLGDEAFAPSVERALDLVGVPARRAAGRSILQTRPAVLLAAVARFLRSRRFDDFASLLRHPDLPVRGEGVDCWLTLLDRYAQDHLQSRVTGAWLGTQASSMKAVHDAVWAMLPEDVDVERPLPRWALPIAGLLAKVYASRTLHRYDHADAPLIESLECVRDAIDRLAALDEEGVCTPNVPLHGAITLLLEQLAGSTLPPPAGEPAVELVGFLELPLDDADLVIIAGVNEGSLPSSSRSDALLPGGLRRKLGVSDNDRRLARDLYALTLVLHARRDVTLVCGKRSTDGDPLAPSRLILRCAPSVMADRLRAFYGEESHELSPPLILPGVDDGPSRFAVPMPLPLAQPITSLRVTAFRDYLACPYRFYLRHVLKLEALDDDAVEMSGGAFGTVAHRVLRAFGKSDLFAETHTTTIARFLSSELDREVRDRFGPEPGAAVVLQREQLRERLLAFAGWQAAQAREGWRIMQGHVECRCSAVLDVDGEAFAIRGDVDRIDEHPDFGYRVIDYKTRDDGLPPEAVHRKGPKHAKQWIDLQLPLYRELARELVGVRDDIELGYVQLPRSVADVGWTPGEWSVDELDGAVDEAKRIVRAIRVGTFWRPAASPAYADDFVGICLDRVTDRDAAIAMSELLAKEAAR